MARAGKQHIVRIRESIYADIRRKKQEEGRVEGVNQFIENILSAYAKGAIMTQTGEQPQVKPGKKPLRSVRDIQAESGKPSSEKTGEEKSHG